MKSMSLLAILLSLFYWVTDTNFVTSRYPTLDAARADNLFDRGWLPDILPPSANDIRTTNNVDINTSEGAFEYSDTDAGTFFARLTLGAPEQSVYANWQGIVRDYTRAGYASWTWREDGTTWTFFCHAARDECEYVMW